MKPSCSRSVPRRVAGVLFAAVCLSVAACGGAGEQRFEFAAGKVQPPSATVTPKAAEMAKMGPPRKSEPLQNPNEQKAESYEQFVDNPFVAASSQPLSTFSASVDTASYSNVRRHINQGQLPPPSAVRIADMVNYFDYQYPRPKGDDPVAIDLELGPCPWNAKHHVLRIALAARKYEKDQLPPRNLVFLVDTSGSMGPENRLPLVRKSLKLLVEQLTPKDRVAIVTYAGDSRLALKTTPGDQKEAINRAIDSLTSGGSTHGSGGINAAYEQASASFMKEGINRVILATDGDFNVDVTGKDGLVKLIEEKRNTGVYLTILGYGYGNLKDANLEGLAHHGNGYFAYIDSLDEAKKVFSDQGAALVTVAKDVKLQVAFNPKHVNAYRLIGYENRVLKNEDFRNDKKDAGDMGSGHTCTALFEIVPAGVSIDLPATDVAKTPSSEPGSETKEFLTVRMRYKHPESETAKEFAVDLPSVSLRTAPSADFRFTVGVAAFGMILRDSPYKGGANFALVKELAEAGRAPDVRGYRAEFIELVKKAEGLKK